MRPYFSFPGGQQPPCRLRNAAYKAAHPKPTSVKELQAQMTTDVLHALTVSSQKQYLTHWKRFTVFTADILKLTTPLLATQHHLALYVTHLHNLDNKAQFIRSQLASITFYFNLYGHESPCDSFHTNKLLQSYSRTDPPVGIRKPVTKQLLHQIMQEVPQHAQSTHESHLLQSLFSLMYHALLRVSEVTTSTQNKHNLKSTQIKVLPKELHITFYSYKFSKPIPKVIAVKRP